MRVQSLTPETRWTGGIQIEFDNKREAEVFFSLFNTSKVADIINGITGDKNFAQTIYSKALELGVNNSVFVGDIANRIKTLSY